MTPLEQKFYDNLISLLNKEIEDETTRKSIILCLDVLIDEMLKHRCVVTTHYDARRDKMHMFIGKGISCLKFEINEETEKMINKLLENKSYD